MAAEPRWRDEPSPRRRRLRTVMASPWVYRGLLLLSMAIVVQHLLAHAGWQPLSLTMGWQDVVVGYPTAVLVAFAGLFVWGRDPVRR